MAFRWQNLNKMVIHVLRYLEVLLDKIRSPLTSIFPKQAKYGASQRALQSWTR